MPESLSRRVRLLRLPSERDAGLLAVTAKNKTTFYVFREIPCAIGGRGFVMHRLGLGTVYHVRVGKPAECSCECLGFLRHGKCKHIQGLLALVGHGLV
jgi:SWIM zinc finger